MRENRWWSWDVERPAALIHRQSGWRVSPVLFSSRAEKAWALTPGPALRLGERALDGSGLAFTTDYQDTALDWTYDLGAGAAAIRWRLARSGEWGLRYWVLLCVEGPDGAALRYDPGTGALRSEGAVRSLRITPDSIPSMAAFHDTTDEAVREIEANGYFHLGARGVTGRVAALRFNLEQAPRLSAVLSLDGAAPPPTFTPRTPPEGSAQGALQAVHDVMAWNHVHDHVNDRPYTALTRFWNTRKFGGFGVWLDDVLFNGMMWSLFDAEAARANVEAVAAWQTEAGNFPCLVTGNDSWLDRSQIPVAAFVAWSIHARTGDSAFLRWAYPRIARNNAWWRARRSLGDQGFIVYGTSSDVGEGLYKGTKFGAKNESSMDNSPIHDPAPFDAKTGLLQSYDVGLNSLYALDCEMLGHMAAALGDHAAAARHFADHRMVAEAISTHLWDEERGVFANRLADGGFIAPIAPTSFYPLTAAAATDTQARAMATAWLDAPDRFGGRFGLPSITRADPAYPDNVYWRGRIWGPMNFWTYLGLRRAGLDDAAQSVAERGQALFDLSWRDRLCGENYNAETGAIFDGSDADGFYAWGALLPLATVFETAQLDPWTGLSIAPSTVSGAFGPVATPFGPLEIRRDGALWTIAFDGAPLLSGSLEGRLTHLVAQHDRIEAVLPPLRASTTLRTPGRGLSGASLDGAEIDASGDEARLPATRRPMRIVLTLAG